MLIAVLKDREDAASQLNRLWQSPPQGVATVSSSPQPRLPPPLLTTDDQRLTTAFAALGKFYGQAERAISTGKLRLTAFTLPAYRTGGLPVPFLPPAEARDWEISSWGVLHAYMHSAFITTELRYPAVPLA